MEEGAIPVTREDMGLGQGQMVAWCRSSTAAIGLVGDCYGTSAWANN